MSFLAPLYIAGALAVALPILFHLIRQTPQGRQSFSSLMFLSPSPPRITRRSRLNNILLLLLRATALVLLALAFARPFLFQKFDSDAPQAQGRRVALLVDTSASMTRGDLWPQAAKRVDDVLRTLGPTDQVALLFFDKDVRPGLTFTQWNEADPARRADLLRARVADEHPRPAATRLGDALAAAADLLAETERLQQGAGDAMARQVVLISDLQRGAHADALQGHQWPPNVSLDVRIVAPADPTNASLQWVKESPDAADPGKLRVRVGNEPDSRRDGFTLRWAGTNGPVAGIEPLRVYVPPGRSQVLRIDWPAATTRADRLILDGDGCDFDNTLYVVPPRADVVRLVYVGTDAADDPKGLRFYVERLAGPKSASKIDVRAWRNDAPPVEADLAEARAVVVTAPPGVDQLRRLRGYAEGGGTVLWVLADAASATGLADLAEEPVKIEEAPATGHALVGRIDTADPLFAPFADPRFSDFTKVHFWKHRRVEPAADAALRAIAWFDNRDPFLLQKSLGRGRLVVAASGWQPADSQLALSTKFVPLMDGLLRRHDAATPEAQYGVGDPIPVAASAQPRIVVRPDGKRVELAAAATAFDAADVPGGYVIQVGSERTTVAVNLPASEGNTAPLAPEELEQWGAKVGAKPVADEQIAKQRQLKRAEIENRQKLWHWLIAAALAVLVAETALAGRMTRRTFTTQVST